MGFQTAFAQTGTEKPSKGLLNRSGDVKGVKVPLFLFKVTKAMVFVDGHFSKRAMIQVILNMNGRKATVQYTILLIKNNLLPCDSF
jgi:hypothetical protein